MLALLHNRRVTMSVARFEMGIAKWSRLDNDLKELATLAVASQIGCSWCMDFGYYVSRTDGMDAAKLEQVAELALQHASSRHWSARSWSTPRR